MKQLVLSLALVVGLAACDTMNSINPFAGEQRPEPCPKVTVVDNLSEMTRFQPGDGRDIIDVLFEAEIVNVLWNCEYDYDSDTYVGTIDSQVIIDLEASRGPANTSRVATVDYFIALADADRTILQKSIFRTELGFPGNFTRNRVREEPVNLEIPLDGSNWGEDFEIILGLQLSREELEFNSRQAR